MSLQIVCVSPFQASGCVLSFLQWTHRPNSRYYLRRKTTTTYRFKNIYNKKTTSNIYHSSIFNAKTERSDFCLEPYMSSPVQPSKPHNLPLPCHRKACRFEWYSLTTVIFDIHWVGISKHHCNCSKLLPFPPVLSWTYSIWIYIWICIEKVRDRDRMISRLL